MASSCAHPNLLPVIFFFLFLFSQDPPFRPTCSSSLGGLSAAVHYPPFPTIQCGFPRLGRPPDSHLTKRQHTHVQPTPTCKQNGLELPSLPLTPAIFFSRFRVLTISGCLFFFRISATIHFLSVTSFSAPSPSYLRAYIPIPIRPVTNGASRKHKTPSPTIPQNTIRCAVG